MYESHIQIKNERKWYIFQTRSFMQVYPSQWP